MKIATYNVNGVNGRLPVLLRWLKEKQPDIVCLQELKAPEEKFPIADIRKAGYGAIWHGQKSWNGVAILARGADPVETRRGLPGDPDDTHSRYIEAQTNDLLVGCIYLPNGNPAPGPDHLMLSPARAYRLTAAGVDRNVRSWEKTSDHAPTWIELTDLKLSAAKRRTTAATKKPVRTRPRVAR